MPEEPEIFQELDDNLFGSIAFDNNGWYIEHPILQMKICELSEVPSMDIINNVNEAFRSKSGLLDAAEFSNDWFQYVSIIEPAYRLDEFIKIKDRIEDPTLYWQIVAFLWIKPPTTHLNMTQYSLLFNDKRANSKSIMSEDEFNNLANLPDNLTVWRGSGEPAPGWSWSLNRDVAIWFAKRRPRSFLLEGTCNKSDVVAYFSLGAEEEIVISPDRVRVISTIDAKYLASNYSIQPKASQLSR